MFESLKENKYFTEVVSFLKQKNLLEKSYLVGGSVRDLLLKHPLKNLDFAVKSDTIQLARDFAKHSSSSFVLLDEVFSVGRVVKDDVTIDFSELRGGSIEFDLSERDFTINAIALPLSLEKVIDLFEGMKDLKNKVIKMVKEENLKADPLRVLRAYRFHATLNFDIEEETREALKRNSHLMKVTAKERIKDELWKTLSVSNSLKTVKLMFEDNIFSVLFKTSEFILLRPDLKALEIVEKLLENHQIKNLTCLKFSALFDFHASQFIKELKPSKKEQRFIEELVKAGVRIKKMENLIDKLRFIRDFEHILEPALIYGISKDPWGINREWFYKDIEDFYKKIYIKNKKKLPVIKGDDIVALGFEPSQIVGEILERIQILVLAGKISNKEEAIKEIKKYYFLNISSP